jgi:hypothetical protein
MISFRKMSEKTVNLILAIILSYSFVLAVIDSLQFKFSPFLILFLIIISMSIFFFTIRNKQTTKITLYSICILLIASIIFILGKGLLQTYTYNIGVFIYWVADFVQGFGYYDNLYALILTIFISFGISLYIFLLAFKYFKFILLLISGISLFAAQWVNDFFTSYMSLYIFLFIIVIYYFRYIHYKNRLKSPNHFVDTTVFTVWIIPISAIILLISFSIPPKMQPMQWKWLDQKVTAVNTFINKSFTSYKGSDYFTITNSGFGDSGKLGGRVKLNKTVVLKVASPRIVYLKGSSKDFYSGTNWKTSDKTSLNFSEQNNEFNQNVNQFVLGFLNKSFLYNQEKYLYNDTLKITFENLKSKSLFITAFTNKISLSSSNLTKNSIYLDGTITSNKVLSKGFSYSINVSNPMYNDNEFIRLLKKSNKGIYAKDASILNIKNYLNQYGISDTNDSLITWDEAINKYKLNKIIDLIINKDFDDLSSDTYDNTSDNNVTSSNNSIYKEALQNLKIIFENINKVYSKYLQIPNTTPKRVKILSESITSGETTNYDKVKAIEQYLATSYPYTLKPKSTPSNRDFVDYFLFDLKEGYCTYFATAMTIMVRSIGLPARYVEGYVLPPEPKTGTIYEVTNEQAHAWVEVYFENMGWVPFEPTSVLRAAFYDNKDYIPSISSAIINNPAYNNYLDMMKKYMNPDQASTQPILNTVNLIKKDNNLKSLIVIVSLLIVICICFFSLIIVNSLKYKIKLLKIYNLEPRESIIENYLNYMRILSLIDLGIRPGETPGQYSERVDSYLNLGSRNNFRDVTKKFLISRYSQNILNVHDKQLVSDFNNHLYVKVKKDLNNLKYFVLKYLFGKI